jgi:formyl-CoA transferase
MDKSEFYRDARHDLTGPLAGVRVLEATTTWAGPMCGCILADLGADVIKIDSPEGDVIRKLPPALPGSPRRVSVWHATINRNKRNLTLDMRPAEGRAIFLKLAARSDIVVQNFRPGTMERWRLGYDDLRAVKRDIIYVSVSGFGQFGPGHDRVGYDPLAQAEGGFMSLNGAPDGPPYKAATFLCDDLAGLHGAIGALAALRHRDQTGEGQHVDVSLLDAMLFQSDGYLTFGALGLPLNRMGNEFDFSVPTNTYQCRDGTVMAGVLLDAHWKTLAGMIGRPELADDPDFAHLPGRQKNRARCNQLVGEWCATRTVRKTVAAFAEHGVPCAHVRSYADASRDPLVIERDMLQPTSHEDGTTAPVTGPAAKFSRTPTRVRHGAPALGAHTEELLEEIGIDAAARKRLREAKIV